MGNGADPSSAVDIDQVIRYFVVHNFVCNGDSYTGDMVHNYYLYEASDGKLSMIPWDYNLAFGAFQGGDATSEVNDAIDTPLSVTGDGDRPMFEWILSSDEYTSMYHQYFEKFLSSVDIEGMIAQTAEMIAPYVQKDPTAFFTYDEFTQAVSTLTTFCNLREQSVLGQLAGTIPSTDAGQSADSSALIDASGISLNDMGEMGNNGQGGSGAMGGDQGGQGGVEPGAAGGDAMSAIDSGTAAGGGTGGMSDMSTMNSAGAAMSPPTSSTASV